MYGATIPAGRYPSNPADFLIGMLPLLLTASQELLIKHIADLNNRILPMLRLSIRNELLSRDSKDSLLIAPAGKHRCIRQQLSVTLCEPIWSSESAQDSKVARMTLIASGNY